MNIKRKRSSPEIEVCFLPKLSEDGRVARNLQWGGYIGGLGAEPSVLENFAFFRKANLLLGLF